MTGDRRPAADSGGRYSWLSAGTLALGIFAALTAAGVAQADAGSGHDSSRGPGSATHRTSTGHPAKASRDTGPALGGSPVAVTAIPDSVRRPLPGSAATAAYTVANKLPSRLQWNTNEGYCGEVSFISAGLYYGQYMSQYDARAIAGKNAPQNTFRSQLLLGLNDVSAAKSMHLTATPFNTAAQTSTPSFLNWVKANTTAGYPVAIGVYMNEYQFYGDRNPAAGDPEYDHIVTVTGVTSKRPLTSPAVYYADDVVTFSDHGLWTGTPTGRPQYLFSYAFGSFAASRRRANAVSGPIYSLPNGANYGIAITGVADKYRETVPVRLTTSTNSESPAIAEGSTVRPAGKPVTLTVTVSGLKAGTSYNLYRYTSMASVPDGSFNANAAKAAQKWTIVATGTTYTMKQTIMSNEIAAYRAVPATAR